MNRNKIIKEMIPILLFVSIASFTGCSSSSNSKGGPSGNAPGKPPSSSSSSSVSGTGAYTLSGQTATKSNQSIVATKSNQSGIKVSKAGKLTISGSTITTSGKTTSEDSSNFYGLNAGILAESASSINISNSTITTSGDGANGAFSTGTGSTVTLSNVTIKTTGNSSRGIDATMKGTINATNINIETTGTHCAAIATDRGGGTVNVTGGTMKSTGVDSPGIYCTGNISVTGANITATGSEAAVVEGKNTITLNNTNISGNASTKKRGVMMYQSTSGDAETGTSQFTMNGGTLTNTVGPLFYITNTDAVINLKGATLSNSSGILLSASKDSWGKSGLNGGTVTLNADNQTLNGSIVGDSISSITVSLKNSTSLTSTINTNQKAKVMSLSLDSTSKWNVTGTSYLTSFSDADSSLSNIKDNGNTIYYNASSKANSWLNGKTITLSGGGKLVPVTK